MNVKCPFHKVEFNEHLWCPACLEEEMEKSDEDEKERMAQDMLEEQMRKLEEELND